MSNYRYVYQCGACKKVYSKGRFIMLNDLYLYGICPKCGTKGRIFQVIAKPKLFGLRGWKVKDKE